MVAAVEVVLMLGTVLTGLGCVSGSIMCSGSGGKCTTRALGCKKGRFVDGLCGGEYYMICCIPDPVQDKDKPKPTPPAPFRQCYDCMYSVNEGVRRKGVEGCLDGPNLHTVKEGVSRVNCSGQCSKEFLQVNKASYILTRRCHMDCHGYIADKDHSVYCCHGELCNNSVKHEIYTLYIILSTLISITLIKRIRLLS